MAVAPLPADISPRALELRERLTSFFDRNIYPNEARFLEQVSNTRWHVPPVIERLKEQARNERLWNLFLPDSEHGAGLNNLDYAPLCEVMGRVPWAPEIHHFRPLMM
jgi:acyl-CoA dehydrogenase